MILTARRGILILATLLLVLWPCGLVRAESLEPALEAVVTSLSTYLSDGFATYVGGEAAYGSATLPFANRIAVLFGLTSWGGGNGSRQFLALFERIDGLGALNGRSRQHFQLLAVVQVGQGFERWFKSIRLEQDRILLEGGKWLKSDPHCCPSGTEKVVYRLSRVGLNEVAH